jgi:hypothetical protein
MKLFVPFLFGLIYDWLVELQHCKLHAELHA